MDFIELRGDAPDEAQMEEWIRKVPRDGKYYKFVPGGDPEIYEPQQETARNDPGA
jgi:hypothetical protein